MRDDLEIVQIEVRLVEAVEQHQRVGAGLVEAARDVGGGAEDMAELDRDRDADARLDLPHQVHVLLLHVLAGHVRVGGDVVDVQLQRIGAGFLESARVAVQPPGGDPVEAGDDRNPDSVALKRARHVALLPYAPQHLRP